MSTENFVLRLFLGIKLLFVYPLLIARGFRPKYYPLENAVIVEISARLSPETRKVFEDQLAEVNYLQRTHFKRSGLSFFKVRRFAFDQKRRSKFQHESQEKVLASLTFRVRDKEIPAEIHLVNGNVFSLEFYADVRPYIHHADIDIIDFTERSLSYSRAFLR